MSAEDMTVRILQEIRDELRESREEQRAFRQETTARFEASDQRFEVIETTLRDLAQQMVMHGRGIRLLLERRGGTDVRLDALESRVDVLESKIR